MMPKQASMGAKVLLVSDDRETGQIWVYVLGQRGLSVTTVRSTKEALNQWEEGAFDLAVVDVHTSQPASSLSERKPRRLPTGGIPYDLSITCSTYD